jgi:hypothetical protein
MPHRSILLGTILCLLLMVGFCRAQSTNATITGNITDQSGSIIPDATVEITAVGTGVVNTVKTNDAGIYRVGGLVPGVYRIRIVKEGFKAVVKEEITLHVQDQVSLNFALEIGSVTESVTVEAGQPLLQTESTDLSQVVEGRTVAETPLNGRNVLNLVTLVPGVVAQGGTAGNPTSNSPNGWGNYQIGGGMANQSSSYLDGAPINVSYVNLTSLMPSQDSIQEFRVATNNVSPQYGRFAGGVVNFSTKSGTNQFHGSAFEYIRNNVLNANNFFNNRTGLPRPEFTQNQFGATLGGPIRKDRMFGFFSWEGFQLRTAVPYIMTVPTVAMRSGDFSSSGVNIYDPYTTTQTSPGVYARTQFMGCNGTTPNVICANRIDPTATTLLTNFPAPNLSGNANNFSVAPSTGGHYHELIGRMDWALSKTQTLFARFSNWQIYRIGENPFKNSTGRAPAWFTTDQFVVGDDLAINNSTAASVRLSYLRFIDNAIPTNFGTNLSKFGSNWAALGSQMLLHQNPVPNISGVNATGGGADFTNQDTVVFSTSNIFTLSANITKMIGRHTVMFGGEARKIEWYDVQNNYGTGYFSFDNGFTAKNPLSTAGSGQAVASFMIGTPSSGLLMNVVRPDTLQWYAGAYASDAFRVSNHLTINAGARWEQPGSFYERRNWLSVLTPNATDPLSAATGLSLKGQVAIANTTAYPHGTQYQLHWKLFSPRVGFTYQLREGTVIRGGYGIAYLPNDVGWANALYASPVNQATTNMTASLDGNLTPYATLSNPFPAGLTLPITNNTSRLSELEGGSPSSPLPANSYGYTQQDNFNIEHQFGKKTVLQIGYGGAKGTHLPVYSQNLNQLPDQYDAMGSALLTQVANPFYGHLPATSGILGKSPTIAQGYLLKPYPQFLNYTAASPWIGASAYNSLQAVLRRSLGAGGNVMASYTWSKFMSNTDTVTTWLEAQSPPSSLQDNYNLHDARSISADNVPQFLVISYVADIPVGQGKFFLANLTGLPQAVLGGWGVSGVSTFRSGFPLIFTAQPTTLSNNFGAGTPRPNVVAGCQKSTSGASQTRLGGWFNTACFTQPSAFGYGNESRIDSGLKAGGVANWDMALSKSVSVKERVNVQFKAEVFNLANRVQFSPPGTTLGTGSFGIVSGQYNQPRLFQFGLRTSF